MMGRTHMAIGVVVALPVIKYLDLPYVYMAGSATTTPIAIWVLPIINYHLKFNFYL